MYIFLSSFFVSFISCSCLPVFPEPHCIVSSTTGSLFVTSGFWPRVRARALHAPVFWGLLPRKTGRCAPPPHVHRSFAASYSIPKNRYKKKISNSGRPRDGLFRNKMLSFRLELRPPESWDSFFPLYHRSYEI